MYLVKRGQREESIDKSLEEQTRKSKIKILYNSNLQRKKADIIATGLKRPPFIVTGILFGLKHPDKSIVLLDNNLSHRCYSYFIVNDNRGEIACSNPKGLGGYGERLALTVKRFEQVSNVNIQSIEERFTSVVNFGFLNQAKVKGQYFVGGLPGFTITWPGLAWAMLLNPVTMRPAVLMKALSTTGCGKRIFSNP